ncbi:MAG: DUF429 domain-containing protein [Pseudomonadota bacterium]
MTDRDVVVGVDGCPAGWLAVYVPVSINGCEVDARFADAELRLLPTFQDVLSAFARMSCVAVDIPIGLPDAVGPGGRGCDVAARKVLGARQSAIFSMPSRDAVMCDDYRAACQVALETSAPPRKISKQAFHLFPKIREVDALMSANRQDCVVECHPEVAFWNLNGQVALETPKKVKSRPNPDGIAFRRMLLKSVGYTDDFLAGPGCAKSKAGEDDLLDACVNAWSASRIAAGHGIRFPDAPMTDRKGLRMEIWG